MDLSERSNAEGPVQRHPWELARYRFLSDVLRRSTVLDGTNAVLDVGSGDAWFAQQLCRQLAGDTRLTCCDIAYTPDLVASLRAASDPRIEFCTEPPAAQYGLVLLLDVLEHVADDLGLLRGLVRRNLAPGGRVLISVPAWPQLFTRHDGRLRHQRRYSPAAARSLVEQAGLTVVHGGGLFHSLLLARALQKAASTVLPGGDGAPQRPSMAWHGGRLITLAVDGVLRVDNVLSRLASGRSVELPGLSWWALCRTSS